MITVPSQFRSTPTGLVVFILVFFFLIGVLLVFSNQILTGIPDSSGPERTILVVISVGLPVVLLGIIIFQIVRLIHQRATRQPGSRLKTKLVLFFVLIALMSTVPLAMISVNFITSGVRIWLEAKIGEALGGGQSISLQYYRGTVDMLRTMAEGAELRRIVDESMDRTSVLWRRLQELSPQLSFIQIFESKGEELMYEGSPSGRTLNTSDYFGRVGSLPKEERGDLTILRHGTTFSLGDRTYYVLLGSILPPGFNERVKSLTDSLETFTQLERFQDLFQIVIVGFYFVMSLPLVLVSILVSFLLTEELILPIANLFEATRRVAVGDFSFRILARSDDELSVLVNAFNHMVSELEASRRNLLKAEKISAWQEIARRLAHEIKNPLTPIRLSAERILKKYQNQDGGSGFGEILESAVSAITTEVENLNNLLEEFRDFARLPDPSPERFMLRHLVEETVPLYETLAARVTVDFTSVPEGLAICADPNQLKQVLANLITNSIQAMSNGGNIFIGADIVKKDEADYCRIQVRDTGDGIDLESRDQVFEPYFTTKKEGTGLGLAIVERIVFDHGGNIWYETRPQIGTTFFVDLPLEP